MRTNPNIITSGNQMAPPQLPDVNAMMQTRTAGMENIYALEQQRAAQAQAAQKEQEAEAMKALSPAIAAAFSDPSDAGLDAALALVPPQYQGAAKAQLDQIRALPDTNRRKDLIRAGLVQDEAGRTLLGQLEMTASQRANLDVQREQNVLRRAEIAQRRDEANKPPQMTPYQAEMIKLAKENAAREATKAEAIASGERGPTEPQKGEVWNREAGRYDAVPGSKLYNETSKKHSSDFKDASIVADKIASAQDKLDYILDEKNKDGFEYNFGGYNAAYIGQNAPVESAQDMYAKLESLKADLKGAGLEQLRAGGSIGQITEAEWPIIEKQIDSITPYMGEQAARDALTAIKTRLDNIAERATEAYDMQWGDTQFYSPVKAKDTGGGGGGGGGVREGATATNPQTGERIIYRNGKWQPL